MIPKSFLAYKRSCSRDSNPFYLQGLYVFLMIYSLVLDYIGNALFYVALWMDEEVAFLRITCESQVRAKNLY